MTLPPARLRTEGHPRAGQLRLLALALTVLAGYALTSPTPPAAADTTPAAGTPATVSSDPLPTVQVDGVVWSQAVVGSKVFAGGNWGTLRPAGAAAGTSTVAQPYLLAYDIATGVRDSSFAPVVDGQVRAVAASPDGKTVYIGGDFAHVNGKLRNKLAAFDTASGALLGWAPGASAAVMALAVTPSTVYVGGIFTAIAVPIGSTGVPRTSLAALDPVTGAVQTFNPTIGGTETKAVKAIAVSPDRTKVMIGGQFETVNGSGNPGYGLALLNASTAASLPLQANQTRVRNAKNNSAINALTSAADGVYGVGQAFGNPPSGTLEGTFKADWNGNLVWIEDCHGDSYSVYPNPDAVYVAGHPHYCGNIGGFEETPTRSYHRAVAFTRDAQVTIGKETGIYNNFYGVAAPHWLNWFPDFNTGTKTGLNQGPWNVTGSGDYVVYGGEFTTVNGKAQQGLVRFVKATTAPNLDGPRLSGTAFVPAVQNFAQGVRLSWLANYDRDNELLTYKVIRNGNTASPVYTTTQASTFWQRPTMAFLDKTAVAGTAYTYRVDVTDPFGNKATGGTVSVTAAAGTSLSAYDQKVLADGPQSYWRLAETSGTAVTDVAGTLGGATRQSGVTQGVTGAIVSDPGKAYRFPGTSSGFVATNTAQTGLQSFSTEAWFRSTSTAGGLILSFGSAKTGSSSTTDRQLYLSPTGQVVFGTNPTTPKVIASAAGKNDGAWHHVVGTVDITGQRLYLDGAPVGSQGGATQPQRYTGYWRIGGDAVTGWPNNPATGYLAGDVDDAAVYDKVITSSQVSAHYSTGKAVAAAVPFAADTFNRTVSRGFGKATTGGAWTASSSVTSVSKGAGRIKLTTKSNSHTALLGSAKQSSADVTTTTSLSKVANGGGTSLTTYGRRVSSTADYRANVVVTSKGKASISVGALRGSSTLTKLSPTVTVAGSVKAGTTIHLRLQVSGRSPTTVRAKLWLGSASQPSAWTVTGKADSYAKLQTTGSVGVKGYLSKSATNSPVTLSVLDIKAVTLG